MTNNQVIEAAPYTTIEVILIEPEKPSSKRFWIGLLVIMGIGIAAISTYIAVQEPTTYIEEYPSTDSCVKCFQEVPIVEYYKQVCSSSLFQDRTTRCEGTTPCCCPQKGTKGRRTYNGYCPSSSSSGKCLCTFQDARGDSAGLDSLEIILTVIITSSVLALFSCIYCCTWRFWTCQSSLSTTSS